MEAAGASILAFLVEWASAFWATLRETAPFLALGLVLAGTLHVLVPSKVVLWALGHSGWRGAVRGALIGTPLPLCSCSVIPTALTLRRQGASLSSAAAFTVATPETSIDALAITAALLPAAFLGVRPAAALLLAVLVGVVVEYFSASTREQLRQNVLKLAPGPKADSEELCRVCGLLGPQDQHRHSTPARARAIFEYAFGAFFRDIATWLIIGIAAAALIQVAVPSEGFRESWLTGHAWLQVLLAIIVGIPLYACATATTPLAAVLLAKGLDPGAALALLLAGPATNIGNVFALKRELGARVTAAYYGSLFVFCWLIGMAFSAIWPLFAQVPWLAAVSGGAVSEWLAHGMPGWLEIGSAWLLIFLTLNVWYHSVMHRHRHEEHEHAH
jgi:hypothetical protein